MFVDEALNETGVLRPIRREIQGRDDPHFIGCPVHSPRDRYPVLPNAPPLDPMHCTSVVLKYAAPAADNEGFVKGIR